MRVRFRSLISVMLLGIGSVASAGELVSNGGFETGDFTSWSPVGTYTGVDKNFAGVVAYEGNYQAWIGYDSSVTQNLATTVNGSETISFALADYDGFSSDSFQVYFGGNLLATLSNTSTSYTVYSYTTTATSTSTDLSFVVGLAEYFLVDAVSVNETAPAAVPEPSTLALICVACVSGLGHTVFRPRKAKLAV